MNPVIMAARYVANHGINRHILTQAYLEPESAWRPFMAHTSLESKIREVTIEGRVLSDCDIVGGKEVVINVRGLPIEYADDWTTIIKIPPERVDGRRIISAHSLNYYPNTTSIGIMAETGGLMNLNKINDVSMVGQRIGDSYGTAPTVSTANIEVEGFNTIIIRDRVRNHALYELRCIVGNNENLSNLPIRNQIYFNKLCVLAAKAHCYWKLSVDIDMGRLEAGRDLGEFKNQLSNFADSEEMYLEMLQQDMGAIFFMADAPSYERFISVGINPSL